MSKEAFIAGFIKRAAQLNFKGEDLRNTATVAYTHYKQALDLTEFNKLKNPSAPSTSDLPNSNSISSSLPIGLVGDARLYGLPSAVGALIGNNYNPISDKELKEELDYTDKPSISKALKYLLMPGYTGYRMAKTNRLEHAYDKYRDAHKK
jgi:hypothetical protein